MKTIQFTLPGFGLAAEVAPSVPKGMHRVQMRHFDANGRRLHDVRIIRSVAYGVMPDGDLIPVARSIAYDLDGRRHRCNASCQHAHGPDCECACGGANHGKARLGLSLTLNLL